MQQHDSDISHCEQPKQFMLAVARSRHGPGHHTGQAGPTRCGPGPTWARSRPDSLSTTWSLGPTTVKNFYFWYIRHEPSYLICGPAHRPNAHFLCFSREAQARPANPWVWPDRGQNLQISGLARHGPPFMGSVVARPARAKSPRAKPVNGLDSCSSLVVAINFLFDM